MKHKESTKNLWILLYFRFTISGMRAHGGLISLTTSWDITGEKSQLHVIFASTLPKFSKKESWNITKDILTTPQHWWEISEVQSMLWWLLKAAEYSCSVKSQLLVASCNSLLLAYKLGLKCDIFSTVHWSDYFGWKLNSIFHINGCWTRH